MPSPTVQRERRGRQTALPYIGPARGADRTAELPDHSRDTPFPQKRRPRGGSGPRFRRSADTPLRKAAARSGRIVAPSETANGGRAAMPASGAQGSGKHTNYAASLISMANSLQHLNTGPQG